MAPWRRLARWLTALLVGGLAAGGVTVYELTNSAAVRQQVIAQLRKHFVGAEITLGNARLRLLGGITIDNLTLHRRDDPSQTPFLHVPSGVIYHDKELLTRGQLAIRKVKLERPRFTVVRNADGRWNVEGILGRVRPDVPIPTVEVDNGSVVLEVAARGGIAPTGPAPATFSTYRLEVRDVHWTLLNDPLTVLDFKGRGATPAFGPLHVNGQWDRVKGQLNSAIDLAPVSFGPAVLREVARLVPEAADAVLEVAGNGRCNLDLHYRADADDPWHYQLRAELSRGRLVHRDLPMPLEHLALAARCTDGVLTLESLSAQAGPTAVALKGQMDVGALAALPHRGPAPNADDRPPPSPWLSLVRWLDVTVMRLPITPALFARLPASLQKYQPRFQPVGPLDLTYRFEHRGQGWESSLQLRPAGMTGKFEQFPYPLSQVTGTLDYGAASGQSPRLVLDLNAAAPGGRPVTIRGMVNGEAPRTSYSFDLTGDGLIIDEALMQALPAKFQPVARSYQPRGWCDATAHIEQKAGTPLEQDYHVDLRDAAIRADIFPYPLDQVSGRIAVHIGPGTKENTPPATYYEFRGQGRHESGQVDIEGSGRPTPGGDRIALRLRGRQVPLNEAMADAFAHIKMKPIWDMIRPGGRIDFLATVAYTNHPGGPPDLDLTVAPAGATVCPRFFPYAMTDLRGTFQYTPGLIVFHGFTARHGAARLSVDTGEVRLTNGGYYADIRNIKAQPLPLDAALVSALPRALQTVCGVLKPRGTFDVDVRQLVLSDPPKIPGPPEPPVLYWDGQIRFADAVLRTGVDWEGVTGSLACHGRYQGQVLDGVEGNIVLDRAMVFRQPMRNLHATLSVAPRAPDVLQLLDISGQLFGGRLAGEGRVEYGSGVKYDLNLTAIGLKLDDVARHNRLSSTAHLSGWANAELYLKGTDGGLNELEGGGNVQAKGRMYNLPLLLDLLKVSALRVPDGTAFEEAHTVFRIHGQRAKIERLDLFGNAISLGGQGEVNLDGTELAMDIYAVWAHVVQMLPPGLRELPPLVSKNLFKIRATGQITADMNGVKLTPEPVPGLVEPVKQLIEKTRARMRQTMASSPQRELTSP